MQYSPKLKQPTPQPGETKLVLQAAVTILFIAGLIFVTVWCFNKLEQAREAKKVESFINHSKIPDK